jgi:hypothetical protein
MVVVVKWNFNLFINDQRVVTVDESIKGVTAYDTIGITVPKGEAGIIVDLQPSKPSNVVFLCITSDRDPTSEGRLYYNVPGKTSMSDPLSSPTSDGTAVAEVETSEEESTPPAGEAAPEGNTLPDENSSETENSANEAATEVEATASEEKNEQQKEIELDRAHVLIGNSLVTLLGTDENALKTLKFVNTTDKEINIKIVVGRVAAPKEA